MCKNQEICDMDGEAVYPESESGAVAKRPGNLIGVTGKPNEQGKLTPLKGFFESK